MLDWQIHPGPPQTLILLPAFPLSHEMWMPVVERLKRHFTVLAMDFPGFGLLNKPQATGWTFAMVSDEIKKKMDGLKIPRATVCGLSMGGYAALDFVAHYPQRVSGLILANTQASADSDDDIENRNRAIRQVRDGTMSSFAEDFLGKIFSEDRAREHASAVSYLRQIIEAQSPSALINALIAMCARPDSSERLVEITAPTLVITGSDDFLITETKSAEIHQAILGSHLEILSNVGHLSAVEAPARFSHLIQSFMQTLDDHYQGDIYERTHTEKSQDSHSRY